MSSAEVNSNNFAGIFYFPVVAPNLILLAQKRQSLRSHNGETPRVTLASATKSSVKAGVFSFHTEDIMQGKFTPHFNRIENIFRKSIEASEKQISGLRRYIEEINGYLEDMANLETIGCPFCHKAQMVNLSPITIKPIAIEEMYGSSGLDEYFRDGGLPVGWSCLGCSVYEVEPSGNIQYTWTREDNPRRNLASLILDSFPFVQKVIFATAGHVKLYCFLTNGGKWYTFGDATKEEIADHLDLAPVKKPQEQKKDGYIYLIKSEFGSYKIGRTKNLPERLNLFGVKLPFEIELTNAIYVDDMHFFEGWLHRHFEGYRVGGEWFNLEEHDIELLASLEDQMDLEDFIQSVSE